MQLSSSPPTHSFIRAEARKSFSLALQFITEAEDGTRFPLDMTDCELRLTVAQQQYQGGAMLLEEDAVLVDPTKGYVQFNLQAVDLDKTPGEYPFTITLVTAEEYSAVVVKGDFEIVENTDLIDDNVYSAFTSPSQLTVLLRGPLRATVSSGLMLAPRLEIGSVTTAGIGEPASASMSGAYPLQHLNLVLPRGEEGPPGPSGDSTTGELAYAENASNSSLYLTTTPQPVLDCIVFVPATERPVWLKWGAQVRIVTGGQGSVFFRIYEADNGGAILRGGSGEHYLTAQPAVNNNNTHQAELRVGPADHDRIFVLYGNHVQEGSSFAAAFLNLPSAVTWLSAEAR